MDNQAEPIHFRPSKKRKVYRQRDTDAETNDHPLPISQPSAAPALVETSASPASPASDDVDAETSQLPMAEILRLRKLRKQRLGGVEFRAEQAGVSKGAAAAPAHHEVESTEGKEVELKEDNAPTGGIRRFAPQTGVGGGVDRHMMAYIDAELAKRRLANLVPSSTGGDFSTTIAGNTQSANTFESSLGGKSDMGVQRQPAALGKLQEIDLGAEEREKNVALTEKARRRLHGEEPEDDSESAGGKQKVRLGRDGKPWRGGRKRRNSDDIKRDKLVEEILRENKLDIYEEPTNAAASEALGDDDQAADDRIAAEFRREFMDAVSARHRKKPAAPSGPAGRQAKKEEELLKGPKLGGSRSARAAMREKQLKALKK